MHCSVHSIKACFKPTRAEQSNRGYCRQSPLRSKNVSRDNRDWHLGDGQANIGTPASVRCPRESKDSWDEIQRNEDRLVELHELCEVITSFVVVKCDGGRKTISVTPLKECVDDLEALVVDYSRRGLCSKFCNRDSEAIERLGKRIESMVPVMELAATVTVSEQVTAMSSAVDLLIRQLESNWERNEFLLVSRLV